MTVMQMREWISIIVIIVLVLILLDGFRRRWIERKNNVVIKIDKSLPKKENRNDDLSGEFPNGGARKVRRDISAQYDSSDESSHVQPDPLMVTEGRIEPSFSDLHINDFDPEEHEFSSDTGENFTHVSNEIEIDFVQSDMLTDDDSKHIEAKKKPEDVIVINVMAKTEQKFSGNELLPILSSLGMRLGEMSIFHRHVNSNGDGEIMYSMANMVAPGTFDMADMNEFSTPGISFFLQLPNSLGNMRCFDKMLEATTTIKESLDGDLKDENRSVFTRQTIDHCRQRIRDFELKQLSHK